MGDHEEGIFGEEQVDIAIDNIIFEGLDDLIAAVDEAQVAAREDGNEMRWNDLSKMRQILETAKQDVAKVQIEIGKRKKT